MGSGCESTDVILYASRLRGAKAARTKPYGKRGLVRLAPHGETLREKPRHHRKMLPSCFGLGWPVLVIFLATCWTGAQVPAFGEASGPNALLGREVRISRPQGGLLKIEIHDSHSASETCALCKGGHPATGSDAQAVVQPAQETASGVESDHHHHHHHHSEEEHLEELEAISRFNEITVSGKLGQLSGRALVSAVVAAVLLLVRWGAARRRSK